MPSLPWHPQVEQYQFRFSLLDGIDGLFTAGCFGDGESIRFQGRPKEKANVLLIVHHENVFAAAWHWGQFWASGKLGEPDVLGLVAEDDRLRAAAVAVQLQQSAQIAPGRLDSCSSASMALS